MIAAVIAFSAVAQNEKMENKRGGVDRRGPQNVRRQGTIGALQSVNLSDAQKQQLKQLNDNFKQQMQELNKNENITVKEQRERREALTKQHQANVQAILTAEQRKEMEEKKEDWKDKKDKGDKDWKDKKDKGHKGEMDHPGGHDRGDNLRQLNLTDDQGVKIKAVNDEFKTKVQAIQKNSALTNEQKKAQRETAQQQHTAAIKSILTTEQKQKLEALKSTRPDRKAKK